MHYSRIVTAQHFDTVRVIGSQVPWQIRILAYPYVSAMQDMDLHSLFHIFA